MQIPTIILVSLIATSVGGLAKPPQKPRVHQYSRLWTASPFTIKPTAAVKEAASPLERDWSLGSIVPVNNGYSVTLINKKNRKERVRFLPGFSTGEFKLLEVKQNTVSRKESRVLVSKGGQKGWISYDEKVVSLRVKTASKKTSKKPTSKVIPKRPGPQVPGRSKGAKAPRVRHVPRHK